VSAYISNSTVYIIFLLPKSPHANTHASHVIVMNRNHMNAETFTFRRTAAELPSLNRNVTPGGPLRAAVLFVFLLLSLIGATAIDRPKKSVGGCSIAVRTRAKQENGGMYPVGVVHSLEPLPFARGLVVDSVSPHEHPFSPLCILLF
jgi:hypothetical protein